DGNRIAYLHGLGFCLVRHCEIPNCARKTGRCMWRQRLYLKCHRFTLDLHLAAFAKLSKRIGEERIGERVILVEQIERRTAPRAWRALPARNDNLRPGLYRPDFKFARACRGNGGFVRYYLIKPAADGFGIFGGLLQLLCRKSLSRDLRRLDESWANARDRKSTRLNSSHDQI